MHIYVHVYKYFLHVINRALYCLSARFHLFSIPTSAPTLARVYVSDWHGP